MVEVPHWMLFVLCFLPALCVLLGFLWGGAYVRNLIGARK